MTDETQVQPLPDRAEALGMHRHAAATGLAPEILAQDQGTVTYQHAGTTLKRWWELNEAPETREAMKSRLRERIEQLHEAGICHRDLRSENLLVDEEGQIRFVDFLLAERVDPAGSCYDLDGPSERIPVPEAHAQQPGHEGGVWCDS